MTLKLLKPTIQNEDSFRSFVQEILATGEELVPFSLEFLEDDFSATLQRFSSSSQGLDLKESFVPHTTFCLVDKKQNILAVSNLRHQLNANLCREGGHIGYGVRPSERKKGYGSIILQKTLLEAKMIGIKKALITCSKNNLGSIGAILNNSGVFSEEEFLEEKDEIVQRYWISLTSKV